MFLWFFQKFFKFNIGLDQDLVKKEKLSGVNKVYIIKRSVMYVFILRRIGLMFLILGLSLLYIYGILKLGFEQDIITIILIGLELYSNLLLFYFCFNYLFFYNKEYSYDYMDLSKLEKILKRGDDKFEKIFNQTFSNYFISIISLIILGVYFYFVIKSDGTGFLFSNLLIIIFIFFQQIFKNILYKKFLEIFINLEMDFTLISTDKIIFVNQTGILLDDIFEIQMSKIKKVKISGDGFRRRLFGYGSIDIYLEGSTSTEVDLRLAYIRIPNKIREIIEEMREKSQIKLNKMSNSNYSEQEIQKSIENEISNSHLSDEDADPLDFNFEESNKNNDSLDFHFEENKSK